MSLPREVAKRCPLRNKDVWKATIRQTLEDHLVKEGIEFSKEAVDAAHARYVAEIQAGEEAKAKEEKAKAEAVEAARKAAETAATPPLTPTATPPQTTDPSSTPTPDPSTKPLDEETRLLLELAPHLPDVIIDMWNHSALGKGTTPVIAAIERDFQVHLPLLAQEVYQAFKASKGGDETLQGLIKRYTPHPTTHLTPTVTPTSTPTIPPQDPNSSTNQALQPNSVPEGGVKVGVDGGVHGSGSDVGGGVKGGVEGVVDIVERNLKLTAEQAISL